MKPNRMTCKSCENPKSVSGHKYKNHDRYSPAYRLLHFTAILTVLFCMGFLLNFAWEAVHGVYLYQGHDMTASRYVPMLVSVSGMDGLLILGLYGWISLLWRDPLWMCNSGIIWGPVFIISAMILAAVIEYRAVFILNRWAYLPAMPKVSGIGLSPLFQLAVTGLISVGSVRCLCRGTLQSQPEDRENKGAYMKIELAVTRSCHHRPVLEAELKKNDFPIPFVHFF